jgi:hypothetical protein
MNVRLYVCRLDDNGTPVEVVEDYTVPHGSWVQTETAGAQLVPPVLEPAARRYRSGSLGGQEYAIVWQPVNPPFVPERLLKLAKGRDRRFGRNGTQYVGSYRARGGGMPYDRARSYASWYRFYVLQWEDGDRAAEARAEWPVALSEEEVAMILEEGPVQMAGSVGVASSVAVSGEEQLPLFSAARSGAVAGGSAGRGGKQGE